LPAYLPDFSPVLKNWLQFLKPDGWIALVEINDLFGHEPLSSSTHKVFKEYYARQLCKNLYDFEMGSKLRDFITGNKLSIIYEENKYDIELTLNGAANKEILFAWDCRFDRMSMFKQFVGDFKFRKIKNEFLNCLSNKNHYSKTIVKFIIARNDNP
jgi:SAM-dependent methyltransferase